MKILKDYGFLFSLSKFFGVKFLAFFMKIQALFMVIIGPGVGGHLIHVDSGRWPFPNAFSNQGRPEAVKFSHSHTWLKNQKYIAKSQLETP